MFVGANW